MDISAALESGSRVGVHGNSHADVAGEDGSARSDEVGSGGVGELGRVFGSAHLLVVYGEAEDYGEDSGEDSEIKIFFG